MAEGLLPWRRHAVSPKFCDLGDAMAEAGRLHEQARLRHFDSDEGRLEAEVGNVLIAAMRDYHTGLAGRPPQPNEMTLIHDHAKLRARQLVETVLRPHIHRTVEDAIG